MEAKVILDYEDARVAEAIADAVSPDNVNTPKGLSIKTTRLGKKVVSIIGCDCKLSTFIATVDDLLFSVSTAEKTVKLAEKLK